MTFLRKSSLAVLLALALAQPARADGPAPAAPAPAAAASAAPFLLDRVVVRWYAPETGGPKYPQFVFERELAFEARLEALADPDPEPGDYHDRHLRAALDRHIAETLLAALPISCSKSADCWAGASCDARAGACVADAKNLAARAEEARAVLEHRVRGAAKLDEAAKAEDIGADEIDAILRRQARASLYVDRMITPMLEPSELELRDLLRTGSTPFKDMPFDQAEPALKRWYVAQRLSAALDAYYQNARARVVLKVLRKP